MLRENIEERFVYGPYTVGVAALLCILLIINALAGTYTRQPTPAHEVSLLSDFRLRQCDLNTADSLTLLRVPGIGPSMAGKILTYRRTFGCFTSTADLMQIPGIKLLTYQKLQPFLATSPCNAALAVQRPLDAGSNPASSTSGKTKKTKPLPTTLVDINTASAAQLATLPKIGPKLAQRIISYRQQLGFFYTIEQLREVPYLYSSTYTALQPHVMASPHAPSILPQEADYKTISAHPYIGPDLAQLWMTHRQSLVDSAAMCRLLSLTPDKFRKLSPYIRFE